MLWARALLAGSLLGTACVSGPPTSAGIARGLDFCLRSYEQARVHVYAIECECVADAQRRCLFAGLESRCYANGWDDADRDAFTIAVCHSREGEPR